MKRVFLWVLRAVKGNLDDVFGPALQRWRRAGPPDLRPYCGFGTPLAVTVQGRVLRPYGLRRGASDDPSWLNLRRITLRLLSRELSGVSVLGRLAGTEARAVTDEEGYFELHFTSVNPLSRAWHTAEVTLPHHA